MAKSHTIKLENLTDVQKKRLAGFYDYLMSDEMLDDTNSVICKSCKGDKKRFECKKCNGTGFKTMNKKFN